MRVETHLIEAKGRDLPALLRKCAEVIELELQHRDAGTLEQVTPTGLTERLALFEMILELLGQRAHYLRKAMTRGGILLAKISGEKASGEQADDPPPCSYKWSGKLEESPAANVMQSLAAILGVPLDAESTYHHFCTKPVGHAGDHACLCGAHPAAPTSPAPGGGP